MKHIRADNSRVLRKAKTGLALVEFDYSEIVELP